MCKLKFNDEIVSFDKFTALANYRPLDILLIVHTL